MKKFDRKLDIPGYEPKPKPKLRRKQTLGPVYETAAVTYRSAGPWGLGKGEPLTCDEVDLNFYSLNQRIEKLYQIVKGDV